MAMIKTCSTPPIAFPEVTGPVCSFKALQELPLKKCEVAINAWQEGTGDPSPENIRTIHGFSALNILQSKSKNLIDLSALEFDDSIYSHSIKDTTLINSLKSTLPKLIRKSVILSMKKTGSPSGVPIGQIRLMAGGTLLQLITPNVETVINSNVDFSTLTQAIIYGSNSGASVSDIMLQIGSQATTYEPYVIPEVKTISLGETVYGGSYNSVTGDKIVNRVKIALDSLNWAYRENNKLFFASPRIIPKEIRNTDDLVPMCDIFKGIRSTSERIDGCIMNGFTDNYLFNLIIYTTSITSKEQLDEIIQGHEVVYTIRDVDRITTNIGPTPIDTILNTNNIFADTGDTTVQYIKIGG